VCNERYEKMDMHKYAWQHPGSKMWHCIDYNILIHQSQRKLCCDVSVIHRADCWTDHKLLRAKVALQIYILRSQGSDRYRFAGYKLYYYDKVRDVFNKTVVKRIIPLWDKDMCCYQ